MMKTCQYPKLAELIDYLDSLATRADLHVLADMLDRLDVCRDDIASCCQFNPCGYRRNIISKTEHYELLALCWRSGDCTPIHDHRGSSCAFRVVAGEGTEIRFQETASGLICPVETVTMQPGYVCAAEDNDIHQVANLQAPGVDLVTMHIYTPPIQHMRTYKFGQRDPVSTVNMDQLYPAR
ncbi:MAG: cysteine dioxygenase family protein [Phycisphaeraceae bacterium]|nr:cysteine dioxygenase family protein [Phycisphaerales bacterium]MCB9859290.1 cysteine dioxygenase family protein [Phycisphaeraceae bacterium]